MGCVEDKLAVWRTLAVDCSKGVLCVMKDIIRDLFAYSSVGVEINGKFR